MEQNSMQSFLGKGWGFPPAFDKMNNSVQMMEDVLDVEESIRIILDTIPGERVMQPEFGCHIKKLVFEKVDSNFLNEAQDMIRHSLLNFEPRIVFDDVKIIDENFQEGVIILSINYTLSITNTRHNIVYPFYLAEGTNIGEMK